jgi:hypothetical protein
LAPNGRHSLAGSAIGGITESQEMLNFCSKHNIACDIELLAFHTAVSEKAEMHNLSMESAAYRVIEEIRDYNNLGGMKKELINTSMQVLTMKEISARQNNAIMALFKLQSCGVTEDQIYNVCRFFEDCRGMTSGSQEVPNMNHFQGK